ncbi:hypothetical protein MA16_Dca023812 [Dendrobium catenatum]|uniref:Uncharacterized protein n=1 Tax=Dendrobium catenatum TaxID=906689 RepID=A0A2I0XFB2_9ASPA|nr:hypothetical protein MA16_Dca023812 [Dendrobium catenatum]
MWCFFYASMHNDVFCSLNRKRIKKDGFIDVKDRTGKVEFRVTEETLMDRLSTDMRPPCHAIDKECRVLTIHRSNHLQPNAKRAFGVVRSLQPNIKTSPFACG